MSKGWDNTTIKKLKTLIGKGLSTSEIGKRLGLSKNAVVGKLNRLGWNSKSSSAPVAAKATKKTAKPSAKKTPVKVTAKKAAVKPTVRDKAKKTPAVTTVKKSTAATAKKAPAKEPAESKAPRTTTKTSSKNLAMHQRIIQHSLEMANLKPNQCRWPIGDPDSENFHFCGKQVFTGKPYCYEHCRLAYQFTPPKKK